MKLSSLAALGFVIPAMAINLLAQVPAPATPAPAPVNDGLDLRFANGIVAIVESRVITVDDIRKEIAPLVPEIQRASRNEKEFNEKLEGLQDEVIQNIIDKVLIVKEFRKDEEKKIPASYVDNRIAEIQVDRFDNDRSKFLAYLRSRGKTLREYRAEQEEEIIYEYMKYQQRKTQTLVSPVKVETFYNENKDRFFQEDSVKLRMIQFTRANGETDDILRTKAADVIAKLNEGKEFADLAKDLSQDSRRTKGGDWGWQKRSDLRPEFSDPLFKTEKGKVCDPIFTAEGCFLLFAEDRKFAGVQPLPEVRDQIERMLVAQLTRSATERWLERLRRTGYVKHY